MKHVVFEVDEVAVPQSTLDQARAGSNKARALLKEWLRGTMLKKGRGEIEDDYTVVGLRELSTMGVIDTVTIG